VEYHLKSHRRDELIEWIKALLVVPFVLVRELPSTAKDTRKSEALVRERYAGVFKDVEELIEDHSMSLTKGVNAVAQQELNTPMRSKLKMLVPSIGIFFTPLPLKEAFLRTDPKRAISQRRFVAPSFNGISF
jgi:IMP and pyridine-specific 5'-nucleotidase